MSILNKMKDNKIELTKLMDKIIYEASEPYEKLEKINNFIHRDDLNVFDMLRNIRVLVKD